MHQVKTQTSDSHKIAKIIILNLNYSDMDADGDGRVSFPEFLLAWKFKY